MTSFAIVNQCSDPELQKPDLCQQIAICLSIQLNRDVSTYWGGSYRVRWCTPDNPPADGDVVALIVDDLPQAPGAVGYHDWEGKPDIYVARNMCQTLTSGAFSLTQCLSHELIETAIDYAANLWADNGSGQEFALEGCDAVEAGFYTLMPNGPGVPVDVSAFVLPAFFQPGQTVGPYSYPADNDVQAPAPFTTANGGYQITRTSAPDVHQTNRHAFGVTMSVTLPFGTRAAKKAHWSSRTFRRGARVAA